MKYAVGVILVGVLAFFVVGSYPSNLAKCIMLVSLYALCVGLFAFRSVRQPTRSLAVETYVFVLVFFTLGVCVARLRKLDTTAD
jgi:uncharacterized membrane protein SirB2